MLGSHVLTWPSLLSLRAVRVPFQQTLPEGKIFIAPDVWGARCGALWRLGVLGEMMIESIRELSPSGDVCVKVSWFRLSCWAGLGLKSRRTGLRKSEARRSLGIEEDSDFESGGLAISLGEEEAVEEKVDDLKKEEEVIYICEVCEI